MQFDASYKKTTREVQPCPPCPTNDGGPVGGLITIAVMLLALVGLFALVKVFA